MEIEELAQAVMNCPGKVVVIGIGKSGIAAHKIASTWATAGIEAVWGDPVGMWHGELGMLRRGDFVVMVSKSGETEELVRLVTHIEQRGVEIAAIVADRASSLGRLPHAVLLDLGVSDDPWLAPTDSFIAQVRAGDAIAAWIVAERGIADRQIVSNHPGGAIGQAAARH